VADPNDRPAGLPKTNGAAVTSLILAYLTPPLGVVLAVVALRRISATRERGSWFAWVAVILGSVLTIVNVTVILAYLLQAPTRDAAVRRAAHCSTVCISITLYADQIDRLKYTSLPVDHGCIIGA
jgi:hypothetical protein